MTATLTNNRYIFNDRALNTWIREGFGRIRHSQTEVGLRVQKKQVFLQILFQRVLKHITGMSIALT
jgi:hypothetical protein